MPGGSVLFVSSSFPRWPGDSTTPFILHLAQDMQRLGWRIDVLAPHAPGTARREAIDGVSVERFRYLWPASLETVCYQGGALINLRKHPANYMKLPALVFAEWLSLVRKMASRRYDLLHSHWILPQGFAGVLSAGMMHVPHVTTIHGSDLFALKGGMLPWFKRFTLNHVDAVTVNSSVTEAAARQLAGDGVRMQRIPMGVAEPEAIEPAAVAEIRGRFRSPTGPLLLFVGRVVEEKGVEDVIRTVGLLKSRLPGISALIVGDGQDRIRFEALAASLGLADKVSFSGWMENARIPAYLAAADIFVGPSRFESQGLAFIEAMLARVPVIAAKAGGVVDAVIDEETGLLVDIGAPDQIAEAVIRLVRDPAWTAALVERAYHRSVEAFSREQSARRFSELYDRILQDGRD